MSTEIQEGRGRRGLFSSVSWYKEQEVLLFTGHSPQASFILPDYEIVPPCGLHILAYCLLQELCDMLGGHQSCTQALFLLEGGRGRPLKGLGEASQGLDITLGHS